MISLLSQADCSGKSAVIYKKAQVVTVKRVTTDAISLTQLIWIFNCVFDVIDRRSDAGLGIFQSDELLVLKPRRFQEPRMRVSRGFPDGRGRKCQVSAGLRPFHTSKSVVY
jgi:hypothetical protein